ncbi:MAG: O-antigen ligase family protein, partial [Pseudomonadota bacterium]|nr:O-antigen ligase family protein [Pseudomonadota bacterium]
MSAPVFSSQQSHFPPGLTASAGGLAAPLIWMVMASGAVVLFEPAPYDAFMIGLLLLLPALGVVTLTRSVLILAACWLIVAAGGLAASVQSSVYGVPAKHTAISLFLSASTILVAGFVLTDPYRNGRVVLSGMAAGAIFTAVAGLLGYFSLVPGAWDLFTEFGRARGAFKDPNVYGPFIVCGVLWCLHLLLHASRFKALAATAVLPMLLLGVLISFSRGAWLNMAASLAVYLFLALGLASTNRFRLRLMLYAMAGLVAATAVVGLTLQIPDVADFLRERASLAQDYDVGPNGRFAGQAKAVGLIAAHPLGIGALEFSRSHHPEDVHNVYFSMFLNTGWAGGFLYLALVMATLYAGLRQCLANAQLRALLAV